MSGVDKAERQRREQRGHAAEAQAAAFLRDQGYEILAERMRTPAGEIDLIAHAPPILAFVEVKARKSTGRGLYAISARQAARIMAAAEMYLADHPELADCYVRLDLIVVTPGAAPEHFPNAWQQDDGDAGGW